MDHTVRRKIPSIYRWSKGSTETHKSKKKCSYSVVRKKMAFPFPKDKLVTCTPGSGEAGYICILDFAHTNALEKQVPSGEIMQRILSETTEITCFHKPCRSCRWKLQEIHELTCGLQEFRFKGSLSFLKIQSKSVVSQFIFNNKYTIYSHPHWLTTAPITEKSYR